MGSELDMGMKCIKYMLYTVNLMFIVTAALIISVGTTIYAIYFEFDHFIRDVFYSPANLLIAIGVLMLVISVFGCIAAYKESTAMINVFALLLSIVFILDISASIASYSLQGGLVEMIDGRINHALHNYHVPGEHVEALDTVQNQLTCCGIASPYDWVNSSYNPNHLKNLEAEISTTDESNLTDPSTTVENNLTDPSSTTEYTLTTVSEGEYDTFKLPKSCCALDSTEPECLMRNSYPNGCMRRLTYVISQSAFLLGTGAMTIAFIQFVGIIFAIMLAKAVRQAKTDRERRKWEIREQIINNAYTQMEPHSSKPKLDQQAPVIYVPHFGHSTS